jgi:hypothetical protein
MILILVVWGFAMASTRDDQLLSTCGNGSFQQLEPGVKIAKHLIEDRIGRQASASAQRVSSCPYGWHINMEIFYSRKQVVDI